MRIASLRLVGLLLAWFLGTTASAAAVPLDLRDSSFVIGTDIALSGSWSFCSNTLSTSPRGPDCPAPIEVRLPQAWNRMPEAPGLLAAGHGTYRLRLLLPSQHPPLEVLVPSMSTASRLFIDGQLVGGVGLVSANLDSMVPRLGPYIARLPSTDTVDLVLQISNRDHYKGGAWKPLRLGMAGELERKAEQSATIRLLLGGGLVFMALYHMVLWFFRRKEWLNLTFSGIAICAIGRLLIPGDHLSNRLWELPWETIVRLEYFLLGWTAPLIYIFCQQVFRRHVPRWLATGLLAIAVFYSPFAWLAPLPVLTLSQVFWQTVNAITPLVLLFGLARAGLHKRPGAWLQFIAILAVYITSINDTMQARQVVQTGYLVSYAMAGFVFVQWLLLATRMSRSFQRVEEHLESFLITLASAIESKDTYTGGHVERVANYARDLAYARGLTPEEVHTIYLGAIVHDVGKIGVPDSILNKPGQLTPEEYDIIKRHSRDGYTLLSRIKGITEQASIALHHQERWDGSGYPDQLSGAQIPLSARIVAVADYWDAIVSDRPYRTAMRMDVATTLLRNTRGRELDPELVDLFLNQGIHNRYLQLTSPFS